MIELGYEFVCNVCGNLKCGGRIGISLGDKPPWPVLLPGWRHFAHMIVCDQHTLKITAVSLDEKETVEYEWTRTGEILRK